MKHGASDVSEEMTLSLVGWGVPPWTSPHTLTWTCQDLSHLGSRSVVENLVDGWVSSLPEQVAWCGIPVPLQTVECLG